ncbi:MAG: Smr/MutS family protein [Calditrichota bacterium]
MTDGLDDPIEYPINGELDLHNFHPKDIPDLVNEYIRECCERDIRQVRIVHGKGKGVQRDRVHKILEAHPMVLRYWQESLAGSWGATLAELNCK